LTLQRLKKTSYNVTK